jgi:hemolysin III
LNVTNAEAAVIKPRLRGWSHLISAVIAIPATIVLSMAAKNGLPTIGAITYGLSLFLLLATSGTYHTPYWSQSTRQKFQRVDRSMIFVLIAGSYTPFLLATSGDSLSLFIPIIWSIALLGIIRTLFLPNGRRWVTTMSYLAMGWLVFPLFYQWITQLGLNVVIPLGLGGLIYTLGAIAYARKSPNPWPSTFGYHEIFHVAVILASICHYYAVWLVVV